MWFWPSLQLTDYERQYVGMYKSKDKPGVLRRIYQVQLATQALPDSNVPAIALSGKVQIARRSRIFGMTFTGNLDSWRLSVRNTNGTLYTNRTPRTNKAPVVTSLIAGSYANAASMGGLVQPGGFAPSSSGALTASIGPALNLLQIPLGTTFQSVANFPWLIEPNWVCQPNETIIFEGEDISPTYQGGESGSFQLPQILNISFYAWEFPKM
jgi:hypothetical protein